MSKAKSSMALPTVEVKQVEFCHPARINNELMNSVRNDKHVFALQGNLLHVIHKETNTQYLIPLTNVSTLILG